MDLLNKRVLFVNLEDETFEVKSFPDLNKYIGGVGLGLKLYEQYAQDNPVIFSVGPLNGFFPYVSKTSVVFFDGNNVEDTYLGGYLSTRIKFSDLDAIVLKNKSKNGTLLDIHDNKVIFLPQNVDIKKLGLPGKKSVITISDKEFLLDNYFISKEKNLYVKLLTKNVGGLVITGTEIFTIKDFERYTQLYAEILGKTQALSVEKAFFPSCSGCPMGCEKSKYGEVGGNVLVHSLAACQYAESIFSDIGTVFSCLNTLGYGYTHEDLENLGGLIREVLANIN